MEFNQGQGLGPGYGGGMTNNPYLMANAGAMGNYNIGGAGGQGLGGYNNGMGGHLDHPLLNPLLHPHHAPQALPQIYAESSAKGPQHNNNNNNNMGNGGFNMNNNNNNNMNMNGPMGSGGGQGQGQGEHQPYLSTYYDHIQLYISQPYVL